MVEGQPVNHSHKSGLEQAKDVHDRVKR